MELTEYMESRYAIVEEALSEFINSKYEDDLLAMAAHLSAGGKRLRGVMSLLCCEAMGGTPQRGVMAACAVELAHAASLVKDDIMDNDEMRRGSLAFWKRFGLNLGILVPDIIIPHAMLFLQQYGPRCLVAIADAWARTAQGQFLDMPKGKLPSMGDYEHIIGLKTAPLFEVSCDLGVRASKQDWHCNLAKDYGYNCGMAFQIFDDLTDLLKNVGQPWEAAANGPLPMSMQALRKMLEGGASITREECERVESIAQGYLQKAVRAAETFPVSEVQPLLAQLPQYCCDALLAEVQRPARGTAPANRDFGIAGVPQTG